MHILSLLIDNNPSWMIHLAGHRNYFMINLQESMGPGRDRTLDPWICSQTRICSQTCYRLCYAARYNGVLKESNSYYISKQRGPRSDTDYRPDCILNRLFNVFCPFSLRNMRVASWELRVVNCTLQITHCKLSSYKMGKTLIQMEIGACKVNGQLR